MKIIIGESGLLNRYKIMSGARKIRAPGTSPPWQGQDRTNTKETYNHLK